MRRISWIDQRIRDALCQADVARFFWRLLINVVADGRHHGKSEHDHGDMAVPSMPGPCLIVIEAEFTFGGFETVFGGPAATFDQDQFLHRRALGTPC